MASWRQGIYPTIIFVLVALEQSLNHDRWWQGSTAVATESELTATQPHPEAVATLEFARDVSYTGDEVGRLPISSLEQKEYSEKEKQALQ